MTECSANCIRMHLNRVMGGGAGKAGAAQSSWDLHVLTGRAYMQIPTALRAHQCAGSLVCWGRACRGLELFSPDACNNVPMLDSCMDACRGCLMHGQERCFEHGD